MIKLFVLLAIVWLALMPPLFTGGACTKEFDEEAARVERDRKALASPSLAAAYWQERGVPSSSLSMELCRRARPRDMPACGGGPTIQAKVPVKNLVCSLYRDREIRVRLYYDERDRLERIQTTMDPYHSLRIPLMDAAIHWAR